MEGVSGGRGFGDELPELPAWLNRVPIDNTPRIFVEVGEGRTVPADMLSAALDAEAGTIIGTFTAEPGFAQQLAEFTEQPGWKRLPTEPTSVERVGEDAWEVSVGEYKRTVSREGIQAILAEALGDTPDEQ